MAEIIDHWLKSRKTATIEGIQLVPKRHPLLPEIALSTIRGQAEAFYTEESGTGKKWILKKFLLGRSPDMRYIHAIQSILPSHIGFESGFQRKVLTKSSLTGNGFHKHDFREWLEASILMPCVEHFDWAFWADKLREGKEQFSKDQRLLLCKSLSEQVRILEKNQIAHRDLSSTNIFIDTINWQVHLIDWDSLYHQTLRMPSNTTYGTDGYVAPFVTLQGIPDPQMTWRPLSDRFGLAVLNVEFLCLSQYSILTGDGGMFDQREIDRRSGHGISTILQRLRQEFPLAVNLFTQALQANSFDLCPSPDEWIQFTGLDAKYNVPSLHEMENPDQELAEFLKKWKPLPVRTAPALSSVEQPDLLSIAIVKQPSVPMRPAPSLDTVEKPNISPIRPSTKIEKKAPSLNDVENPFQDITNLLNKVKKN